MNTYNCQVFCSDEKFRSVLDEFGLVVGEHNNNNYDILNSLAILLSHPFSVSSEDMKAFLESLHVSGMASEISAEVQLLYRASRFYELDTLGNISVEEKAYSPFALLCSASMQYNIQIIVVCGLLPFKAFHEGSNVMRFAIYDGHPRHTVVIGCVGMMIFHKLEISDQLTTIITRLTSVSQDINTYMRQAILERFSHFGEIIGGNEDSNLNG